MRGKTVSPWSAGRVIPQFRLLVQGLIVAAIASGLGACGGEQDSGPVISESDLGALTPEYVGAEVCAGCHEEQSGLWAGSHHDRAMQVATPDTVLADSSVASFDHNGVQTTFSRQDDQYFVTTEDADGQLREFPIRYTFGVYPLQQYLVELPNTNLHALGVAWDSRLSADGGQRWFHVYGDERIDHDDVLHWTRMSQSWASMCADCHSTGLEKKFDLDSGIFETSWEALNVSCEACHGPGSRHVVWAGSSRATTDKGLQPPLDERRSVSWIADGETGNSRRSEPRNSSQEIDTCAPCHSRRSLIAESPGTGDEFLNGYLPALIQPPLYHVDGQIRDEVYVYGSFLQSRMHAKGVTCSDCHEPHSLKLRAPGSGVCLQCHSAEKFSTVEHQLHQSGSEGAECVGCHMPATTYMQVDPRRDHSFRIPRPELSVEFGTPNACNSCHTDKDANWALQVLRAKNRISVSNENHWTRRFAELQSSPAPSRELLLGLISDFEVPAIIRATAITQVPLDGDALSLTIVGQRAESSDPMIRRAVAQALEIAHPTIVAQVGPGLLDDPVRAVRIAAASALAPLSLEILPAKAYPKLEKALNEYIETQMVSAERAESHVNLGNLQRQRRRLESSEQSYLTAIRLNPDFVPAYVNLADLYREQEREENGEQLLRRAIEVRPEQPALHHSLGLNLVRQGRMLEAVPELELAAASDMATARYAIAYALAIDAQGRSVESIAYLQNALTRFNDDPVLLATLANIYRRMGNEEAAQALSQRLR
jgi:tetratricopeptide (TPR) repeat protein